MTSEPADRRESGGAPDTAALSRVLARQRAELDRLQERAATSAVVERAKGVVMARTGCSPDVAHETLRQSAKAARRTLLEECWIVLGNVAPPLPAAASPPRDEDTRATETEPAPARPEDLALALGRLARALVQVGTPQDLARCLLDQLASDVGADAVMLYAAPASGGLELVGHAGIDETLARQWRHVPPLVGIAALDALRSGRPCWLEDIAAERERRPLIGDPPEQWGSRAWLPVVTPQPARNVIGVLRRSAGPFTRRDRHHLEAVAQLCAGPLRTFGTRREPVLGPAMAAVQAAVEHLPVAAIVLSAVRTTAGVVEDFRIDAATTEVTDSVGRHGRELVGLRLLECWPTLVEEPLWQGCLTTLADGQPYESEPFTRQRTVAGLTELSTFAARAVRVGDGLILSWLPEDLSDRQTQRLSDLQRLGNLGWADWNLTAQDDIWSSQMFVVFDRDPALGAVPLAGLPALALPEDAPALERAVTGLLRDGLPCDVPFRIATRDGIRHLRAAVEAVRDAGGATVRAHGFVQDRTAQRSAELALRASELAVLTQHDALRSERVVAARLQDALLPMPHRAVRLAGLRVEVAYLPAQAGLSVGGDWFSAIELPDGDGLFVVGDVAGHGMDAVATMAQLRFTAKGMIITGSSLTGALTRLNTLLLHSRDPHGTATMVLARCHRAERRLTWAQAGHPPPLLLRGGEPVFLDRPHGVLLGAGENQRYEEATCRLAPGDRLLLYTDGLVERPGECIDLGLERLADALAAQTRGGPASLERLLGTLLRDEQRDDVCVLDLQVPSGTAPAG